MMYRFIAGFACFAMFVGPGLSQEKVKSADEQVKELIEKYKALPGADQLGAKGEDLVKQLKAVPGKLSPQSQQDVARLEINRNLRMVALAVHTYHKTYKDLPKKETFGIDGKTPLNYLLPYLEVESFLPVANPPRPRWEYKVVPEADILKLGKEGQDLVAGLNKLGEENWELVGIEKTRFFFKRQK